MTIQNIEMEPTEVARLVCDLAKQGTEDIMTDDLPLDRELAFELASNQVVELLGHSSRITMMASIVGLIVENIALNLRLQLRR